jgi:transcription initiation factor TFIIB
MAADNNKDRNDAELWQAFFGLKRVAALGTAANNMSETSKCEGCGAQGDSVLIDGLIVCTKCNTVNDRQLDYSAEWRSYGAEDGRINPMRCCPASTTLGSVVSVAPRRRASHWQNRTEATAAASAASERMGRSVYRYQLWSTVSYRDRVLNNVFESISTHMTLNGMPMYLLEEAKSAYRHVMDSGVRGHTRAALVAACVYVACSRCEVPRSTKEMSAIFNVATKALIKACRAVDAILTESAAPPVEREDEQEKEAAASSTPLDYAGRFCSKLSMSPESLREVRRVLEIVEECSLVCNAMPPTITAGAIFLVVKARSLCVTAEEIGRVSLMSPVTVVKMAKRLQAHQELLGVTIAPTVQRRAKTKPAA